MGDAKRKISRRQEFLQQHTQCIYCGNLADTSDHCPPRTFFKRRQWPETFEFPACAGCNASARLDEQALAVLIRAELSDNRSETDRSEWERLVQGVRNNQPHMITEWRNLSRNEIKHGLRKAFGDDGDRRRHEGWGLANIGPLTHAMIARFMIKLSKALYYRHNQAVFDGVIYANHIDRFSLRTTTEFINEILKMAPALPEIERNQRSLLDQFIYRFNHSAEHGVMYAVVQFGDQFIFQLIAISREMDANLLALNRADLPRVGRHECFLAK